MSFTDHLIVRGKSISTGKWVKGFYTEIPSDSPWLNRESKHGITEKGSTVAIEIDIKTIGQYRPDIKAFDGDWIQAETNVSPSVKVEGVLVFDSMECQLEMKDDHFPVVAFAALNPQSIKVTDKNIHDSPELLQEDE